MAQGARLKCGCSLEFGVMDLYDDWADVTIRFKFCVKHEDVRLVVGPGYANFEPRVKVSDAPRVTIKDS